MDSSRAPQVWACISRTFDDACCPQVLALCPPLAFLISASPTSAPLDVIARMHARVPSSPPLTNAPRCRLICFDLLCCVVLCLA